MTWHRFCRKNYTSDRALSNPSPHLLAHRVLSGGNRSHRNRLKSFLNNGGQYLYNQCITGWPDGYGITTWKRQLFLDRKLVTAFCEIINYKFFNFVPVSAEIPNVWWRWVLWPFEAEPLISIRKERVKARMWHYSLHDSNLNRAWQKGSSTVSIYILSVRTI